MKIRQPIGIAAGITAAIVRRLDRRQASLDEQKRLADERALLLAREQAARAEAERAARETARLFEAERGAHDAAESARRRLALLTAAATALAEAQLDLPAVHAALCRGVVEAIGDSAAVLMLSEDGETLQPVAAYEEDPTMLALRWEFLTRAPSRVGIGINGRVAKTGEPILLARTSPAELKAVLRPDQHPYLDRLPTYSMLAVPIRVRGRIFGTLGAARHSPDRPYTLDDLALLQELADRAALAIDNARLYAAEREAVAARDAFLTTAAHELKTPITSLQGSAQLLLKLLDRGQMPDADSLRRRLGVIDTQSHRLGKLVGQLLDVSRLEVGKLSLERQPVDVAELVTNAVAVYRSTGDGERIALSSDRACVAAVDALRLEQVIANLLDNALKFSPPGSPVEVAVSSTETAIAISVTDHGAGIPLAQRDKIFDRFFQAHASVHLSGLGLGLYISRQIVELHGGTLVVEFPDTGGTRFVVCLPRCYNPHIGEGGRSELP